MSLLGIYVFFRPSVKIIHFSLFKGIQLSRAVTLLVLTCDDVINWILTLDMYMNNLVYDT